MQRRKEHRSMRQVAFGLCDCRLWRESIYVVRRDIENLLKLPKRFRETPKGNIGICVFTQCFSVARAKPLSFIEVCLAPLPLAAPPHDISQRCRNLTAIRQG